MLEDLLPLGLQTMCLLSFALNKNLGSHNCFKCVAHENVNITLGMCGSESGNLQAYVLVLQFPFLYSFCFEMPHEEIWDGCLKHDRPHG